MVSSLSPVIYIEGWILVVLAIIAAVACWRNAGRLHNATQVIRYMKVLICLTLAAILTLGLTRVIDGTFALALLLSSMASLLVSLLAREVAEAPPKKHEPK